MREKWRANEATNRPASSESGSSIWDKVRGPCARSRERARRDSQHGVTCNEITTERVWCAALSAKRALHTITIQTTTASTGSELLLSHSFHHYTILSLSL